MAAIQDLDQYDTTDEVFEDVKNLIWHTCHAFTSRYGGDVEEHFQESSHWFIARTIPTFDPTQGRSFSGWTRMRVFNHLLDKRRQESQRLAKLPRTAEEAIHVQEDRHHFDLNSFKRSLSRDAAIVVHMTTNSWNNIDRAVNAAGYGPHSSQMRRKKPEPEIVKQTIEEELREVWDWTPERIESAFTEIAEGLN